ncbi:MAG: SLBB domain-containing protein [Ignavibacteria bacterium]|nr:SLBB domain-containing protein [Ignavibacteria bacterium]
MRTKFVLILILIIISTGNTYSQTDRMKVGNDAFSTQQGGYYNYGDKDKVNIEVNVWGYVRYPGKYLIPQGSTMTDLISYSGGPVTESRLEDIRLYRPKNDSLRVNQDVLIKLDYNDLLWEERVNIRSKINTILLPGDILIITGEPRYFSRDNVNLILAISSVLISLGILVISITNK